MSFLRPQLGLQDEIDYLTSAVHVSPFSKHVLIYYVAGNPGLIEYYRNFLKFLTEKLNEDETALHQTQFHIHGESLAGFQFHQESGRSPYNLDEIKWKTIQSIEHKAKEIIKAHDLKQAELPVILIGHSIGTWLILESIAWSHKVKSRTSEVQEKSAFSVAKISGGILLFPTVVDLAKSPNGLRVGWVLRFEYAALILSIIAEILLAFVPVLILTPILQLLLQMPYHGALVTASFLKSQHGVRQALQMAHGEVLQVGDDAWSDQIWGVQKSELPSKEAKAIAKDAAASRTKLYFFWGANDHWVANATRDALLAKRGRTSPVGDESKPTMVVDSHCLPHAFSLRDRGARIVATRVSSWIVEILRS